METQNWEMEAWVTSPIYLDSVIKGETRPELAQMGLKMEEHGWVKVGTVSLALELPDENTIKLEAVKACNEAIKKVRADTEVKVAHLEQMIQNLLAIEHTPKETLCEDEGCPFYGTNTKCEQQPNGCKATVLPVDFLDVDDDIPF